MEAAKKSIKSPDETRTFEKGKIDLVNIGQDSVGLFTLEPGWKWSDHVKPVVQTDLCQQNHFGYQLQGRLHVTMQDGSEFEVGPGDVWAIPAGHDAWVVGDEASVSIDWTGASTYAQR